MAPKNPISQQGDRQQFDAIVIGSGIAGLTYILELLEIKPDCNIALITKQTLPDSNSSYAQGGIAAVSTSDDSIDEHITDTLKAGDGLSNVEMTKKILELGPKAIDILQSCGVQFDRENSHFDLAQEGGHSHRRIYHVGDHTGKAIIDSLIKQIKKHSQVKIFEYHTAINLIKKSYAHIPGSYPEVIGAFILDEKQDKIHTYFANVTILATGGAGKVFRYTSNRECVTGDGIAMAYRAGARVGNLEFYQFHPTLLYHLKLNNFLISEALRGEGAYLINPITHERFMKNYAAKKMELSTRDVVARAIFNEIEKHGCKYVYLDMRHQPKDFIQKRFPLIYNQLLELGIDMSQDLIPVVPGAHYLCGGILTDEKGQTDLQRLFAIGETAFTGLHGANRLASNSLLEAVVMAHLAAQHTVKLLQQPLTGLHHIKDWNSKSVLDLRRGSQISANWRGLRGEMTSYAGIIRTEAGLKDLLKLISTRQEMIENYYWNFSITRDLIELRNISLVAELIVRSALNRRESRGGHFREDCQIKLNHSHETIFRWFETQSNFE